MGLGMLFFYVGIHMGIPMVPFWGYCYRYFGKLGIEV